MVFSGACHFWEETSTLYIMIQHLIQKVNFYFVRAPMVDPL